MLVEDLESTRQRQADCDEEEVDVAPVESCVEVDDQPNYCNGDAVTYGSHHIVAGQYQEHVDFVHRAVRTAGGRAPGVVLREEVFHWKQINCCYLMSGDE